MLKEEALLQKRLIELSRIAYNRNQITYSEFLNMNELNILHTTSKKEFYTSYKIFGGSMVLERQMVAFLPDAFCDEINYPVSILHITPLNLKFADALSHRDYLGAILNIGIERCKIGDILVDEKGAIVFVQDTMKEFIQTTLIRIKHTAVQIKEESLDKVTYTPSFEEIKGTIASIRLDSLLSLAFASSRSKLVTLIEGAKVFVNGKLITTNSYNIADNDIISVRGLGKFQYKGIQSSTKKGRYCVLLYKYI